MSRCLCAGVRVQAACVRKEAKDGLTCRLHLHNSLCALDSESERARARERGGGGGGARARERHGQHVIWEKRHTRLQLELEMSL
jgi:hypothetical protein